jgi:predicted DNA-binding protein
MASTSEYVEFSIRVPRPMHRRLEALAKRELSTKSREVLIAIRAHLDAEERRQSK